MEWPSNAMLSSPVRALTTLIIKKAVPILAAIELSAFNYKKNQRLNRGGQLPYKYFGKHNLIFICYMSCP